jgi:hypothetical protein
MAHVNQVTNRSARITAAVALVALLLLTNASVEAGEVTNLNWYSGIASVGAEPIVPPPSPNNDDVAGPSPNGVFIPQKAYVGIGPVDLVFDVDDSGGTAEYMIVEGVSNSTGIDWTGYRLELGFGHGSGFVLSASGDELDFDAPDFNSPVDFSSWFPTWDVDEDVISVSGGTMPHGAYSLPYFRFHVDVPDGIDSFTIRQIPIAVPEPSAMALSGVGLVMLYHVGQGRKRRPTPCCINFSGFVCKCLHPRPETW